MDRISLLQLKIKPRTFHSTMGNPKGFWFNDGKNFGVILVGAEDSNLRNGLLNNHEKIVNVNNKSSSYPFALLFCQTTIVCFTLNSPLYPLALNSAISSRG
jgi:hypothetical protein